MTRAGFRDILTNPHASKIAEGEGSEVNSIQLELVDKTIETERVVESFLDFLSSGSFSVAEWTGVQLVRDTLRFARKWQCTTTVRLLLDLSRLALLSQEVHKTEISPERFFALGAEHEDIALCAMAIEHAGGWQWTDEGKYVGGNRKGRSVMDPTAWNEDQFEVNPRYYWALTVATNKEFTDPSQADTERWKRIANKFETIVQSKKGGVWSVIYGLGRG